MKALTLLTALAAAALGACSPGPRQPAAPPPQRPDPMVARLGAQPEAFAAIRTEFTRRNPGYAIAYHQALTELPAAPRTRVLFAQSGSSKATCGDAESEIGIGDIALVRQRETFHSERPIAALVFEVPEAPPRELPSFIRPDWDPRITDVPGGCATETGAYRRILLTWEARNGAYLFHSLNAHRVRMMDSLTHYHPVDGGFDEFYLVQMALPEARVVTSRFADRIIQPDTVTEEQAAGLMESRSLVVGDLVYLPRGLVHRGLGGVLAQVITVPGFRPGAQTGVDPQLLAINRRLRLDGTRALPYNAEAAVQPDR
jgi:hypothetical protein